MKPTERVLKTPAHGTTSHITDTVRFFAKTIEAYEQFRKRIVDLTSNLSVLTPQQLVDACEQLRNQRAELAILDQQLFAIIDLAGSKFAGEALIQDFRVALAKANLAADTLYRKLRAIKVVLQEGDCQFGDREKIF